MFKGWRRLFQRDRQLLAERGGGALGSAYLFWLCVGLMRGRVRSTLAGDMEEMEGE